MANATKWVDLVDGVEFSAGDPSERPVYNPDNADFGKPSLTFDGTDDVLVNDDFSKYELGPTDDLTCIKISKGSGDSAVSKKQSGSLNRYVAAGDDTLIRNNTGDIVRVSVNQGNEVQVRRSEYDDSEATLKVFANGELIGSDTTPEMTGADKSTNRPLGIGADQNNGDNYSGDIALVYLKRGLLTAREINFFSHWLRKRGFKVTRV